MQDTSRVGGNLPRQAWDKLNARAKLELIETSFAVIRSFVCFRRGKAAMDELISSAAELRAELQKTLSELKAEPAPLAKPAPVAATVAATPMTNMS